MKVLVTGAGGNLGRVLLPRLAEREDEARAADLRELDVEVEAITADLRDPGDAARAVAGVDAVVHGAALHGIHVGSHDPGTFWRTNVDATFGLFEAARGAGVRRFVLCSTMAVYGASAERTEEAWAVVTDEAPTQPTDVYGLTKLVCEEIGRHYARAHGLDVWALRLGMFVPETFERYGFRLLFGGVDDRDVADAVIRALDRSPPGGFATANVMAETPLTDEDAAAIVSDPAAVLERHWPRTTDIAQRAGLDIGELLWGWAIWRSEAARRLLGWRPAFGFGEFLSALERGDRGHYPFAELPQWQGFEAGEARP